MYKVCSMTETTRYLANIYIVTSNFNDFCCFLFIIVGLFKSRYIKRNVYSAMQCTIGPRRV